MKPDNATVPATPDLASIEEYDVRRLEAPMSARELFLSQLGESLRAVVPQYPFLRGFERLRSLIGALDDPMRTYALCESCALEEVWPR